MRVPNIHAVVLRKVGNTIATSVWPEYNRVIDRMGIRHLWKQTKKPYTLTYIPTGQTIQFYGLDDPGKLKSIAVPFGYFGVMHFEEFDQYDGPEEVRNVEQSVFRGGPFSFSFKTFNSPAMARHWVNRYKREPKPKQFRHHTTYLTTPPEWLGPRFFDDAETLKQRDPVAYAHEYMGEVVGCGTAVFENLELRPITSEEIAGFDRRYYGLDFGWYPDPNHFGGMSYDHARQTSTSTRNTGPRKRPTPSWPKCSSGICTTRSPATVRPTARSLHCVILAFPACEAAGNMPPTAAPA